MKKSNPTKKKTVKKTYARKITWQVQEDGPVHEVPEAAMLSFHTKEGLVQMALLSDGTLVVSDLS